MIISLVNQKGGVGKTTLAVCLAYQAWLSGERVLLVDADPQQSIMEWSDKREKELPEHFSVVGMAKNTLHRDLPRVAKDYGITIIDAPPRTTDIARSTIVASDLVIIPCTPSPYDVWASKEAIKIIKEISISKEQLKYAMVINIKRANTVIGRDIKDAIIDLVKTLDFDIPVLNSEISQRIIFAETAAAGLAVQEADPEQKATKEINLLYEEIKKHTNIDKYLNT